MREGATASRRRSVMIDESVMLECLPSSCLDLFLDSKVDTSVPTVELPVDWGQEPGDRVLRTLYVLQAMEDRAGSFCTPKAVA